LGHSDWSSFSNRWSTNLYPNYMQDCQDNDAKVDFFTVFGVFFSGLTTLLHNDYMCMVEFTFWNPFVLVVVIFATWSASLSNMIGDGRVL
jgi:hypothetical protein